MTTRELNQAKKMLPCQKCGRLFKTDRCHRTCPKCVKRPPSDRQHGVNFGGLTKQFALFNSEHGDTHEDPIQ